ncbi:hypothetical protein WH50_24930 [Pokkaliibacter plantistimulans]|uniref:Uncharacterized protein n=1 Tax=Pokkaliibacter plantistimulans TaxID=1635171 RepID=A0ABX5LR99_9GAMM|nr:hypothetical protein WH50_24930 [Pokkaliibacter plantistimulans]
MPDHYHDGAGPAHRHWPGHLRPTMNTTGQPFWLDGGEKGDAEAQPERSSDNLSLLSTLIHSLKNGGLL